MRTAVRHKGLEYPDSLAICNVRCVYASKSGLRDGVFSISLPGLMCRTLARQVEAACIAEIPHLVYVHTCSYGLYVLNSSSGRVQWEVTF